MLLPCIRKYSWVILVAMGIWNPAPICALGLWFLVRIWWILSFGRRSAVSYIAVSSSSRVGVTLVLLESSNYFVLRISGFWWRFVESDVSVWKGSGWACLIQRRILAWVSATFAYSAQVSHSGLVFGFAAIERQLWITTIWIWGFYENLLSPSFLAEMCRNQLVWLRDGHLQENAFTFTYSA